MLIDIQSTMKLAAEIKKILHIGEAHAKHAGRVLVLNGACVVGHRVVERLIDAEFIDLRVGMRTLKQKEETRGVELVPFVWEDETTYDDALKDVKTVFVTLPVKPKDFDKHFPNFLKSCTTNHVKRIIKLSFYHSMRSKAEDPTLYYGSPDYVSKHDAFHDVPLIHKHALCDGDLVVHKDLNVTILFASHLMCNVFRYGFERKALEDKQEFYGASGGKGVNYVSPNDVADVAVKVIFDKTHKRQAYTLTGPSFVTDEEVATLLTDKLGTKITYVEKPLDFFDENTASLEKIKATGLEENFPKGDTKKVLGRDGEKFEDYLKATDRMTPFEQEVLSILGGQDTEPIPYMGGLTFRTTSKTEEAAQTTCCSTPFMGTLNFHTASTTETEPTKEAMPTPFMGTLNFHTASTTEEMEQPTETTDEIEPTDTVVEVVEKSIATHEVPTIAAQ